MTPEVKAALAWFDDGIVELIISDIGAATAHNILVLVAEVRRHEQDIEAAVRWTWNEYHEGVGDCQDDAVARFWAKKGKAQP